MALIDTLYDIISGVAGTLFGATVTYAINYRRNRRIMTEIENAQQTIEKMRVENERLMGVIRAKEDQILATEQKLIKRNRQ